MFYILQWWCAFSALTLFVGRQEEHPTCKIEWWGVFVASGSRCRLFAYGPADATAIQKPRHVLRHLNPDWFYPSGTGLPRFFLEQRPLNGCSSSSLQGWYVVVYIGIFCSGSWSNCRVHLLPSLFFLWFWHSEQVSWLTVSQQNGLCLLYCHLSFSFSFFRTLASLSLFLFSILQWRFFVFFYSRNVRPLFSGCFSCC